MRKTRLAVLFLLIPVATLRAQKPPEEQTSKTLERILKRLDDLEQQNRELSAEVKSLRQQLAVSHPTPGPAESTERLDERITVNERRVDEQAQSKIEASQKFPVTLTGMLLFNAFANSRLPAGIGTTSYYSSFLTGPNTSGATFRQTLLGFDFHGPDVPGNGKVTGSLNLDLSGGSNAYYGYIRLRRAGISLDWKDRGFFVGQDKPLVSPREPNSLAEVSISPLAGAGNLWLWLPQARYEERRKLADRTGITGQVAVIETAERVSAVPYEYASSLEAARPGLEGRLAFWHEWGDNRRIEFGSGFHTSTTHVAGAGVPSSLVSADWLVRPSRWIEWSGTVFGGKNFANLGALSDSVSIIAEQNVRAIHGSGGWTQLSFPITSRFTFNTFGGWQANSHADLFPGAISNHVDFAGNIIYRLGPSVLISGEAAREKMLYLSKGHIIGNHYDLALAYLF